MRVRWFSPRFRSSATRGKVSRNARRFQIESLEQRQLLAVNSNFAAGLLTVSANAADNIAITASGGNVLVNGGNPGGGPAVAASSVTGINVAATGVFANTIDLSAVSTGVFTGLPATAGVTLNGGPDNDTILGSAVGDLMIVGGGNDNMTGNEGDDIFDLSGANASVDPGAGVDTIRYIVTNPAGEAVSLSATATERLEVTGGTGPDMLTVAGGAQVFIVTGGGDADTINGSGISNASAQVTLNGGAGNDTISGGAAGDLIIGGGGFDDMTGNDGDDIFDLSGGNANVNPGAGSDTIRYIVTNPAGETVSLGATATERLELTGGSGPDNLTVTGGGPLFIVLGLGGTDAIDATGVTNAAAQVTLDGGSGNDVIAGGVAGERIIDGSGDDILTGGAGNDTYVLTPGSADVINDTGGDDTADFSGAALGITINMDSTAVQIVNSNGDTVDLNGQIENFIGSPQNDTVTVGPLAVTRTISGGGNGAAPGDRLTLDSISTTIGVTSTSFSIGGTVNYDTFETIALNGTAGADIITVTSTPALAALTIDGLGDGDDYIVSQSAVSTAGLTLADTGAAGNDDLFLNGGAVHTITYNHTNASSGTIVIDPDGPGGVAASTIAFSGFEPIANSGTATNIIFNLTAGVDAATLTNLGGGMSRLASAGSFETTDFVNPAAGGSLSINAGGSNDTLTITSLAAGFGGSLFMDGQVGVFDRINVDAALILGGSLSLTAELIAINTTTIATGGNQAYTGPVTTSPALDASTGAGGQIAFSTTVAAGNGLTLTADEINFGAANSVNGSAAVTLQPTSSAAGTAIAVGGAADLGAAFLDITDGDIAALADGFSEILIGRIDGQHTIGVGGGSFKDTVTIRAPGAAGNISVDQQLDTLASLNAANITLNAPAITLNDDVVTSGGTITITSTNITLGTNATVTIDSTNAAVSTGANIDVTGAINDDLLPSGLAVSAGTAGDATLSGPIEAATPVDALTVTANDISLGAIGGAAAGATGATTIAAANNGGDTGSITLTGTTYHANAQTYDAGGAANAIQLTGGAAGSTTAFTTSADPIAFTGAVDLNGRDMTIATTGGAVTFNNSIDGAGDLSIAAGTGDVTIAVPIGVTAALTSATISGNDISLANIGAAAAGITGATTVTAANNGGDTGSITFSGTTYNANAQTYDAGAATNAILLAGGAAGSTTTFTTSADTIAVTGAVDLNSRDLTVNTANGAVTFNNTINGAGDITINSGTGVTTFSGVIGGTTNVASLTVTSGGPFTFVANATAIGAIDIAVADVAGDPRIDSITQNAGTTVRSTTGAILYRAGDDIALAATASLNAATTLTIQGDFSDNDAAGAIIDLLGTVNGVVITIDGGNDDDAIRLSNSPIGGTTTITADLGDDTIDLGSTSNTLGTFLGPITVVGNGNTSLGDALNLNDQGAGGPGNDYDLTSTQFTRNGIAAINYSGIEGLTLGTSSGSDDIVVGLPGAFATPFPATVRMYGGTGTDVIRYNGSADADTLSYSDIAGAAQHRLSGIDCSVVVAGAGSDTINNQTSSGADSGLAVPSAMDLGTGDDIADGAGRTDVIYGAGGREVDINAGAGNDFVFPDHDAMGAVFVVANEGGGGLTLDGGPGLDRGVFLTNGVGDTIGGFESGVFDGANINDVIMWLRAQFLPGGAAGSVLLLAEAAKCANWHHNYSGTDLGSLTTQSIPSIDASSQDTWYEFRAAQSGLLSAQATFAAAAGGVELAIYDDMLTQIDSTWSVSGSAALGTSVVQGGHYYFRVRSVNPNVALRLSIGQPMAGDFNHDGLVSIVDLSMLRNAMGSTSPTFDLNGDGVVSTGDLAQWLAHSFGNVAPPVAPSPAAPSAVVVHRASAPGLQARGVDEIFATSDSPRVPVAEPRPVSSRLSATRSSIATDRVLSHMEDSGLRPAGYPLGATLRRPARSARLRIAQP